MLKGKMELPPIPDKVREELAKAGVNVDRVMEIAQNAVIGLTNSGLNPLEAGIVVKMMHESYQAVLQDMAMRELAKGIRNGDVKLERVERFYPETGKTEVVPLEEAKAELLQQIEDAPNQKDALRQGREAVDQNASPDHFKVPAIAHA